jgi:hypothetical protein
VHRHPQAGIKPGMQHPGSLASEMRIRFLMPILTSFHSHLDSHLIRMSMRLAVDWRMR